MWYKVAKYGYIDVQKELEEQLGYELPFKVDEYLEYIIIKASKFENNFYTIDFDKLDNFIKNSPFSHFVSQVTPIEGVFGELEDDKTTQTVGRLNKYTKELQLIRSFPKYLLEKLIDTALHEFAHAFDKGMLKRQPPKFIYSQGYINELMPFFLSNKDKIIDENGRLKISVDEMFNFYIDHEIEIYKQNFPIPAKMTPAFIKLFKDAMEDEKEFLNKLKPGITKTLLFIIGNRLYENSVEEALHKEYLNTAEEAPAQLNSLYRSSLPNRLLKFCKDSYLAWLKQTGKLEPLLEEYSIAPDYNNTEALFETLKEKVPNFIYQNLKENFVKLIKIQLFGDPFESEILYVSASFLSSIRSKHVKRQAMKILHENFAEFQKLVNNL